MKKRKRWVVVGMFVVVVAAVAVAGVLWFGRDKTVSVHYLTAKATKGTISQTVQADFTLGSENGATSVALGGGAASSSTSSSSSSTSSTATPTTSSLSPGVALAAHDAAGQDEPAATYAALTLAASANGDLPAASDSGSPSPSPSPSPTTTSTPTPTPTPTPTRTGFPTPTPSPSASRSFTPSGGSSRSGFSNSGSTTTSATTSSGSSSVSGVVTRLVLPAGATPATLQRLLLLSGKPVFAFVSPTPLWKNLSTSLSSGSQRVNVTVLQRALKAQGYYKKAISGRFTSATGQALKRWQKANGVSATGVVDVTRFVWMPTGSVLTSWTVNLGSHVSSGAALASVVSPSRLSADALVSQADIAGLKVGQKAQMTIDGYGSDAFTGRISFISSEPASSSSANGSSSSTQYSITVSPQNLPKLAKSGMTGTLDIVLAQRANVLLVPTTAVSGSSTTSFVRVMQDGKPVYRQVQTGMATSSYTEITGGLAEGETVVTGQYTNGATNTGTTSPSTSRLRSGGGFGGGFPGGGFPAGGGQ
jgi:HlyD family secretion protein